MQGVILKREKEPGSYAGLILGDNGVRYPFTPHSWRNEDVEPEVGMRVDFEVRDFEGRGSMATGVRPADESRQVSREPAGRPPVATPAPPAQTSAVPPTMQGDPLGQPPENIGPAPYEGSAAAYESGTTVQAGQSKPAASQEVPTTWMVALAIVPVVLLILTLLPITPWFTRGGEGSTEYESLWDTFTRTKDSWSIAWEGAFGAYVLVIVGAVALAIAMLMYRQSNQKLRYPSEENEAFDDRLDLFLSVSILISGLTLLSALFAWTYIELGPLVFSRSGDSGGYSLGPLLFVLAMFSIVGFLVSLAANETIRNRFLRIDVSTFVSFKGRLRRPTFALITVPVHVQNLVGITATLFLLAEFAPSPLDRYLMAPYGILIDSVEQHASAFLPWIGPTFDLSLGFSFGFSFILQIATFYVWLAVCAKRYHDLDKSGWWVLVSFIPIVGPIWILTELGFKKGTRGYNSYGLPQEQEGAEEQSGVTSGRETSVNQDRRQRKDCPYCADLIAPKFEVVKCRYCGSNIPTSQEASETQPARRMKACPYCAETIMYEAVKCRYCGSDVPTLQQASQEEPARRMKTCSFCAETIMYEAVKCRYCGSEVSDEAPNETDSL